MNERTNRTNWSLVGAVSAAIAASACCTIPLILVSFGIGGAWVSSLTALEPYRPFFIAVALGFLSYAAYRSYRAAQEPECECEDAMNPKAKKALLIVGVLATLALIVSPWLLAAPAENTQAKEAVAAISVDAQEVALDVEGMTCAGCTTTVSRALTRLDGVLEAEVTYQPAQAIVRYDPARVSVEALTGATRSVGYPSTPIREDANP